MATQSYREVLDKMAGEIRRLYASKATGDLAALRRLDPDHPSTQALHRLLALAVPEPFVRNVHIDGYRGWPRRAQSNTRS